MVMEALNTCLRRLYKTIEDGGLYINLNHDVRFSEKMEIPLNLNETETIVIAEESYNSAPPLRPAHLGAAQRHHDPLRLARLGQDHLGRVRGGLRLRAPAGGGGGASKGDSFGVLEAIHEATIHGHQELTEEKMIGRPHLGRLMREGEEEIIPRKFMLSPFRMVDEVNRLTPGRTNNLLEMMDRGFSVYGDEKIYAAEGVTFLTANFRDIASSELTPPFLDRVDVGVFAPTLNPYFLEMAGGGEDRKLTGDIRGLPAPPAGGDGGGFRRGRLRAHARGDRRGDRRSRSPLHTLQLHRRDKRLRRRLARAGAQEQGLRVVRQAPHPLRPVGGRYLRSGGRAAGRVPLPQHREHLLQDRERGERPGGQDHRALRQGPGLVPRQGPRPALEDLEAVVPYVLWFKLIPTDRAWAQHPEYMNDRIALVRDLFTDSRNHYVKSRHLVQALDAALDLCERGLTGETSIPACSSPPSPR